MIYYIFIAILAVLSAAFAQMLLKKSAVKNHPTFIRQYLNVWVIGGYFIMAFSMLINVFVMSRGIQVKEVGAIESFSYLFVPILSLLFFKEKISSRKWVAIGLIMIGVVVFFQ